MNSTFPLTIAAMWFAAATAHPAARVDIGFSKTDNAFHIDRVLPPSRNDAATGATFTLVDGRRDGNGAGIEALNDGRVPYSADEPSRNFFFQQGTNGGRVVVDLGKPIKVKAVNSYSWHPRERGPQVYKLYAAKGDESGFEPSPKRDADPLKCGWQGIARVDTRKKGRGGQFAVSVTDPGGTQLGEFRYLLFDIESPDPGNGQANTFYSEIDVIDADGPAPQEVAGRVLKTYQSKDRQYTYEVDSTIAPDLTEWTEKELMPVVFEWYPKMVVMLPSDGYTAPTTVRMEFRDDMGGTPAYAAGNKLSMNSGWFRHELNREAKGSVIHELVHVIQNYWHAREVNPHPAPTPGWITEGIPDYVRWFIYEPQTKGAEITRGNFARVKYDDSYRVSANFLNWVVENHDKEFVRKLNAAAREGRYSDKIWKDCTGKPLEELGAEWKDANAKRLGL